MQAHKNTFDAWHTDEAYNWFANDEYQYNLAQVTKRPLTLKARWKEWKPTNDVHITKVDWTEVLKCLKT